MQKLFFDVGGLDRRCVERFGLSEDILMENAASGLKRAIEDRFKKGSSVLIVCGLGNNGGDGIALARMLHPSYKVRLFLYKEPKTDMSKLQLQRARALSVEIVDGIKECDVIVDALFGSGFAGGLDDGARSLLQTMNNLRGYKIACDIPSGIDKNGNIDSVAFNADLTVTMGASKESLYSDAAKDCSGEIVVADLGIARELFEEESETFLLQECDLELPFRTRQDSHKGSYGHSVIVAGEKEGAALLSALASEAFGSGLTTILNNKNPLPPNIMSATKLPQNTSAVAFGMGLGECKIPIDFGDVGLVLDADMFYREGILEFLERDRIVLTPHPKEFASLLHISGLGAFDTDYIQKNRLKLSKLFGKKYPKVTLLLKGANPIITQENLSYINPLGSASLAKGGSGDVLSGMICALLAQGYTPLKATINASLAHALASKRFGKNNYALSPLDLIEAIKLL